MPVRKTLPRPGKNSGDGVYDTAHTEEVAGLSHDELEQMQAAAEQGAADDRVVNEMERGFADTDPGAGTTTKPEDASAEDIKAKEENPEDSSEADDGAEPPKGGDKPAATTGDGGKRKSFAARLQGKSGFKKRIALAAAVGGATAGMSALVFFLMLPLKIEHVVQNLDMYFGAASREAVQVESRRMFNGYVRNAVIPALVSGQCRRTIDPTCTVAPAGTGPVGRLYQAWSKNKMENRLARNYGIVFSASHGKYYMTVNGTEHDLDRVRLGQASVFDLAGTGRANQLEINKALDDAVRGTTLWEKTYGRYVYGRYAKKQFGIKRCMLACDTKQKVSDWKTDVKLKAAKGLLTQRIVPEKYGLIMQCILIGCSTDLEPAQAGDEERLTEGEKQMRSALRDAASRFTGDLDKLVKQSEDISKNGFGKVFAREAAKKIVTTFGGDAAAAATVGGAIEKLVPIVGWVFAIAQIVHIADIAGPIIQYMSYALNEATAIEMFTSFQSIAAECKSGGIHCDATALGSFSTVLETNLSGKDEDQVDMTDHPYYTHINGGNLGAITTASISPFGIGSASAAEAPRFTCPDGKPVPSGKLICDDEKLAQGNGFFDVIHEFVNSIPGLSKLAEIVAGVGDLIGQVIGKIWEVTCAGIPNCELGMQQLEKWAGDLFNWIGSKVLSSPMTKNMSGATTYTLMAAGADALHNKSCYTQLGCKRLNKTEIYEKRQKAFESARADFEQKTIFARMFDTESSFSLVSRVAMGMPSNLRTAGTRTAAAIATNPFAIIGNIMNSVFLHTGTVYAVEGPVDDPHDIIQYGYDQTEIPADSDAYWKENCQDPDQRINWLNGPDTYQDPVTGQATTTKANPCLLIEGSSIILGATSDPTIVPVDPDNISSGSSSTGGTSIQTGDTITLAKKILAMAEDPNSNITFQTTDGLNAFRYIAQTGHGRECGAPAISPTLLGVILKLSEEYKLVLGVFDDGHNGISGTECDGGHHNDGSAVDFNGVNPISGGQGTGNRIGDRTENDNDPFDPEEQAILSSFYKRAGEILAANGGGGLGQTQCFTSPAPRVDGNTYFEDLCNHIHMDTRGR